VFFNALLKSSEAIPPRLATEDHKPLIENHVMLGPLWAQDDFLAIWFEDALFNLIVAFLAENLLNSQYMMLLRTFDIIC